MKDLSKMSVQRLMHDYIHAVAAYARLAEDVYVTYSIGQKIPEGQLLELLERSQKLGKFDKELANRADELKNVA